MLVYQGMTIPVRAEINRMNAQHSTGPRTEAGKQQSSLNAVSHGLTLKTQSCLPKAPTNFSST
jgi:hypothetical protein